MTSSYALDVHYREDEPPVRVPLPDCTPEEAETERQALLTRVEHAVDISAPEIFARDEAPGNDVPIEPARVTSIDLIDLAETV